MRKGIRVEFNENKPIIMTFPIIFKENIHKVTIKIRLIVFYLLCFTSFFQKKKKKIYPVYTS